MNVANAYGLQLIIQEVNIQPPLAILGHQTGQQLVTLAPPTSALIGPFRGQAAVIGLILLRRRCFNSYK